MSRPSPSISRSPSVSRPAPSINRPAAPSPSRPSAGGGGARPSTGVATRPTAGQLQNFLDVPAGGAARAGNLPASRPGGGVNAAAGGGAAAEFLRGGGPQAATLPAGGQRPGVGDRPGIGERPGIADRPAAGNRPARIENRQQWQNNRLERRDEVRDQVRENHPRLDFWSDHPNWAAWRINRPYRWATWAAITGWVGYGWTDAIPYSYGENVYYEDGSVYYGDQVVASADEYAQQAESMLASAPKVAPENGEWMPLGVFALTPDGQGTGPDPTLFLQLAVSKDGVISGSLHNSATNSTQTVEGVVDKKSQRCAWNVIGKNRPIMETGISNLTQDTAPALLHFADGQTQQWLMVRLEEPETK